MKKKHAVCTNKRRRWRQEEELLLASDACSYDGCLVDFCSRIAATAGGIWILKEKTEKKQLKAVPCFVSAPQQKAPWKWPGRVKNKISS